MSRKAFIFGFAGVLATGWLLSAQAEDFAVWCASGVPVPTAGNFAPVSTHPNMAASNLVASSTLNLSGTGAATETFAAGGFYGTSSNEAKSFGHYWETILRPQTGYIATYESIRYRFRRSGSGPRFSQWTYSTNGSTFYWVPTVTSNSDSYTEREIILPVDVALQSHDKRVWFRMYAWGGTNQATAWGNYGRALDNLLIFSGTLVATGPVPPTVVFDPPGVQNVSVSNTLDLEISIATPDSGISTWSLSPTNPAGPAGLVGTNFTFTPYEADTSNTYALSVVATNAYGTSTGTASITVSGYVPPPPPGSYICTFEDAYKGEYPAKDVTFSNKVWNLTDVLTGTLSSDLKIGRRAARLQYYTNDGPDTMTIQTPVMSNGIGTISMWYGPFGTNGASAPTLAIEISESLTEGWTEVGSAWAGGVSNLSFYSADLYVSTPVYVRIRGKSGGYKRTANFDNLTITPYFPREVSAYDAFLLQYNVTPGDPGTEPEEDLDGDNVSNTNEFLAGTNPYDEAVHP